MTIIVSSKDHQSEIEMLAESSNYDIEIKTSDIGDCLEVTFDETDPKLLQALISILSSDVKEAEDEDGSRKGRMRWIGDDVISVSEKDAMKMIKAGLGRKGMAYDGAGKWCVSQDAWNAYLIWKKLQVAKNKSKANYRGR